jgi:hypothetical protein
VQPSVSQGYPRPNLTRKQLQPSTSSACVLQSEDVDANRLGLTIFEDGEPGGPGMGKSLLGSGSIAVQRFMHSASSFSVFAGVCAVLHTRAIAPDAGLAPLQSAPLS